MRRLVHVADDGQESRRRISILFIDVVGSTSLAERLDPEALRQIMDSYFAVCVAAIEEREILIESRPSWGGGKPSALTVELGPLIRWGATRRVAGAAPAEEDEDAGSALALASGPGLASLCAAADLRNVQHCGPP